MDRTRNQLIEIVSSIHALVSNVADVASSSREQTDAINGINSSVMELDQRMQASSADFASTADAGQHVVSSSNTLLEAVSAFKITASAQHDQCDQDQPDLSMSSG